MISLNFGAHEGNLVEVSEYSPEAAWHRFG